MITVRKVKGKSMEPTLKEGDFLILQKFFYKNKPNDIITAITEDGEVIKRVKKIEKKEYHITGDNPESSHYKIEKKQITGKIIKIISSQ